MGKLSDEEFDLSQAESQLIDHNKNQTTNQTSAQRQKAKTQTRSMTQTQKHSQQPLCVTTPAKTVIFGKLFDTLIQDEDKENKQVINNAKNDKGKNRFKIPWGAVVM